MQTIQLVTTILLKWWLDMRQQSIGLVSLVVRDYDEALSFFVGVLGFTLTEDTYIPQQDKRWVVVSPPGSNGSGVLLARASTPEQESHVGNQTGGRVFLFLYTDDFWRDYNLLSAKGVSFVRPPAEHPYGIVAVFKDLYGNQWDLVQQRTKLGNTARRTISSNKPSRHQ